jgi:hypothetical protein
MRNLGKSAAADLLKYYDTYSKHWSASGVTQKSRFNFAGNNMSGAKTTFLCNTVMLLGAALLLLSPQLEKRKFVELHDLRYQALVESGMTGAEASSVIQRRFPYRIKGVICMLLKGDDLNISMFDDVHLSQTHTDGQKLNFKFEVSRGYTVWCNCYFTEKGDYPDVLKTVTKLLTKPFPISIDRVTRLERVKTISVDLNNMYQRIGDENWAYCAKFNAMRYHPLIRKEAEGRILSILETAKAITTTRASRLYKLCETVDSQRYVVDLRNNVS